jgi:hypothetical protein
MAEEQQSDSGLSMLDLVFKIVQATLATLAVYRSARSALNAWKSIYTMIRGDSGEATDESIDEAA